MSQKFYLYRVNDVKTRVMRNMTPEYLLNFANANLAKTYMCNGKEKIDFRDLSFLNGERIFEFAEVDERLYAQITSGTQLFSREQRAVLDGGYDPYIIDKDGLMAIIHAYEDKIRDFYTSLLTSSDKVTKKYIQDKLDSCVNISFANIDIKYPWVLTNSWSFENAVYNLIHILKTVDWKNDVLLFYGW